VYVDKETEKKGYVLVGEKSERERERNKGDDEKNK
jgi:hypothetical protein